MLAVVAPRPVLPPTSRYRPRRPDKTPLYGVVQDHFERFVSVYDERYADRYGPWRPHVGDSFRRYLDCGIPENGFLRVRCAECGHEIQVPWSCKRAGLCPSCAQRRALEFACFVQEQVFEDVPIVHVVFSIPKVLRGIFRRERKLLRDLCACAWKTLLEGLQTALGRPDAVPGAVCALASAGDIVNGNPHIHVAAAWGAWAGRAPDAQFLPWPTQLSAERLTELFRRCVLSMLVRRQRLAEDTRKRLLAWEHSGFSAWVGAPILPEEVSSRLRLARYLVKAPVSLERLDYDPTTCTVVYVSSKRNERRTLSGMDFLAELAQHIPDRGQNAVLYHGRFSNRSRGERRKMAESAANAPSPSADPSSEPEADEPSESEPRFVLKRKAFRLAWAALLKRVWDVDLRCSECGATMRVIAAITDVLVAEKILKHLGLLQRPRPPNLHRCLSASASCELDHWPSGVDDDSGDVDPSAEFTDTGSGGGELTWSCDDGDQDPHHDWPVDPPFPED